ncbi:MAG TPA: hypothetical protein PLK28_19820 [Candidatus Rifleibacterium sp.]|nr:hypothetical protein [Candidatus Rifleibacterium sp.]
MSFIFYLIEFSKLSFFISLFGFTIITDFDQAYLFSKELTFEKSENILLKIKRAYPQFGPSAIPFLLESIKIRSNKILDPKKNYRDLIPGKIQELLKEGKILPPPYECSILTEFDYRDSLPYIENQILREKKDTIFFNILSELRSSIKNTLPKLDRTKLTHLDKTIHLKRRGLKNLPNSMIQFLSEKLSIDATQKWMFKSFFMCSEPHPGMTKD